MTCPLRNLYRRYRMWRDLRVIAERFKQRDIDDICIMPSPPMPERLREVAEQHPTYTREIAAWVDRYCAGDTIPGIADDYEWPDSDILIAILATAAALDREPEGEGS